MKKYLFFIYISFALCDIVLSQNTDYNQKGLEYLRGGNDKEAINYFSLAIKIDPQNAYV